VAIYLPMYYKTINTYKNAYTAIVFSFIGGVLIHIALFFDHAVSLSGQNVEKILEMSKKYGKCRKILKMPKSLKMPKNTEPCC
jgi:hypothetical protein